MCLYDKEQRANHEPDTKWDIRPSKIYSGVFETSLNGPGFSITLCNVTLATKESKTTVEELMDLLSAETKAPSWPNVLSNSSTRAPRKEAPVVDVEKQNLITPENDIKGMHSIKIGRGRANT